MPPISIKQNFCLSKLELLQLTLLEKSCYRHDGASAKIYWEHLQKERSVPGNFLYYHENTLVGFLSFFLFEDDTAYISALVHPAHRRKNIFTYLLNAAYLAMAKLRINKIIFMFPQKNIAAKNWLLSLSANFLYVEYCMERFIREPEILKANDLIMKLANDADIELLTTLDVASFKSNYKIMQERFKDTINDKNRQVWLAYLKNKCIGKAHIYFDKKGAFIHDVGIIPEIQQCGYGFQLLQFIVNHLINIEQCHRMHLEVTTSNQSALKIYKQCHFVITDIYEYWSYQIKKS